MNTIFSDNYGYIFKGFGPEGQHLLERPESFGSMFGGDINELEVIIEELDGDLLHIKVRK